MRDHSFAIDVTIALALFLIWAPIAVLTDLESVRLGLGAPLILFAPGYLITAAVFPRRGQIDGLERVALSLGLSIASVALLGLLLNYTPWGLRPLPMASALGLLLASAGVATLVSRRLVREASFRPAMPAAAQRWPPLSFAIKGFAAALILAAVGVGTWIFYSDRIVPIPVAETGFTQFYLLGLNRLPQDYPRQLRPGQQVEVRVGIENNGGSEMTYVVMVAVEGRPLSALGPVALASGDSWERELRFTLPRLDSTQRVDFLLHREGEPAPYRSLHLWVAPQPPLVQQTAAQPESVE